MENLFEWFHCAIGQETSRLNKKAGHFSLPTLVDFTASHAGSSAFKVLRFQVPDQQSIWTQEQGVVVPSGLTQSRQHLRPHAAMADFIFVQTFRFYLQNEANPFHVTPSRLVKAAKQEAALFRQDAHRKNASGR